MKFEISLNLVFMVMMLPGVFMANIGRAVINCIVLKMFHSCESVPLNTILRRRDITNYPRIKFSADSLVL